MFQALKIDLSQPEFIYNESAGGYGKVLSKYDLF